MGHVPVAFSSLFFPHATSAQKTKAHTAHTHTPRGPPALTRTAARSLGLGLGHTNANEAEYRLLPRRVPCHYVGAGRREGVATDTHGEDPPPREVPGPLREEREARDTGCVERTLYKPPKLTTWTYRVESLQLKLHYWIPGGGGGIPAWGKI